MKKLKFQVVSDSVAMPMKMDCQSELVFRAPPTTATPITCDSVHRVTASKQGGRKRFTRRREENPLRNVIAVVMTMKHKVVLTRRVCATSAKKWGIWQENVTARRKTNNINENNR